MQRKDRDKPKKLKYDPVEGLLPEIRRACGYPMYVPPELTKNSGKKKKVVEEEWSMPEAQNCSYCSSGGNILCCETCPASFHLHCLGWDDSDVPDGNFYCNRCKYMPSGVRLFPPETCGDTTPTTRIARENDRNWEVVKYHFKRLRNEHGPLSPLPAGPLGKIRELQRAFQNPFLLQALGMSNVMDYQMPELIFADREFQPDAAMESRRPALCGKICIKCKLKDLWSPMLRCDFCRANWHHKCVDPPLVKIPHSNYWMCPEHPQCLIDSLWQGEMLPNMDRKALYEKYNRFTARRTEQSDQELFALFLQKTRPFRVAAYADSIVNPKTELFPPEHEDTGAAFIGDIIAPRASRKGGRGRQKQPDPGWMNVWSIPSLSCSPKARKQRPQSEVVEERHDRELERLDKKRSIRFTEEELIMSVMPYQYNRRSDYLSSRMAATDFDQSANFLTRHNTMLTRAKVFYRNLPEQEMIKLMRKDLDPRESIRGSGVQTIATFQEKVGHRKKMKADVEQLMQMIGFGNAHSDRRMSSFYTEAFFRRSAPPPSAHETLMPATLREVIMNSQKEADEHFGVSHYHSIPRDLSNLCMLGYEQIFKSRDERDSYNPSIASFWSKAPVSTLCRPECEYEKIEVKAEKFEEDEEPEKKVKEPKVEGAEGEEKDKSELTMDKDSDESKTAEEGEHEDEVERTKNKVFNYVNEAGLMELEVHEASEHIPALRSPTKCNLPSPGPKGKRATEEPMEIGEASESSAATSAPAAQSQLSPRALLHQRALIAQRVLQAGRGRLSQPKGEEDPEKSPEVITIDSDDDSDPADPADPAVTRVAKQFAGIDIKALYPPTLEKATSSELTGLSFRGVGDDELDNQVWDRRRTKSMTDLEDTPIWEFVRRSFREHVFRKLAAMEAELDHSYARMPNIEDLLDEEEPEEVQEKPREKTPEVARAKTPVEVISAQPEHEFRTPTTPPSQDHDSSASSSIVTPTVRRRGRPAGSKNRKEGDPPPERKKRAPAGGRGGRGSRGGRGRGGGRGGGRKRGAAVAGATVGGRRLTRLSSLDDSISAARDDDEDGEETEDGEGSVKGSLTSKLSNPEESGETSGEKKDSNERERKAAIRANEETFIAYTQKMLAWMRDAEPKSYYATRDQAFNQWKTGEWAKLAKHCVEERLESYYPYDQRYFLPTQRVHAWIEFPDGHFLPIAIQRSVTKLGTAHDCHIRLERYTSAYCHVLADYHCDLVREYHSDTIYLSTLATEAVIVDGNVVRRPRLTAIEAAEKSKNRGDFRLPPELKCRCQKESDQIISREENRGRIVESGIYPLTGGYHSIQIGCASLTFRRTDRHPLKKLPISPQ